MQSCVLWLHKITSVSSRAVTQSRMSNTADGEESKTRGKGEHGPRRAKRERGGSVPARPEVKFWASPLSRRFAISSWAGFLARREFTAHARLSDPVFGLPGFCTSLYFFFLQRKVWHTMRALVIVTRMRVTCLRCDINALLNTGISSHGICSLWRRQKNYTSLVHF